MDRGIKSAYYIEIIEQISMASLLLFVGKQSYGKRAESAIEDLAD
jgi:hypothetical protein